MVAQILYISSNVKYTDIKWTDNSRSPTVNVQNDESGKPSKVYMIPKIYKYCAGYSDNSCF
jgi:hypothetical protein